MVEGRNVTIEYRLAADNYDSSALAEELAAFNPDVILATATPAVNALQAATPHDPDCVRQCHPTRSALASWPAWRGRAATSRA